MIIMFVLILKLEDVSDTMSTIQLSSSVIPDELCIEGDSLFHHSDISIMKIILNFNFSCCY